MLRTKSSVAKLHARIGALRRERLHKVTTDVVRTAQVIAIEDLAVKAMSRSMGRRAFRRSVSDAAPCELRRQLTYKAKWAGRALHVAERFFPSSKTYSVCTTRNRSLTLSQRTWTCTVCGTEHDRDLNAARNLEARARRALNEMPEHSGTTRMSRGSHAGGEPGAVDSGQKTVRGQHRRSTNREPIARRCAPNRSTDRSGTGSESGA